MTFKFGDILRYPDDQGVSDDILFMFIAPLEHKGATYHSVMVVRTTEDDDQWVPGTMVTAGCEELIPYEDWWARLKGASIWIDGKEVSNEVVSAGIDIAAGSSTAVLGIRDASGTFTINDVKFTKP